MTSTIKTLTRRFAGCLLLVGPLAAFAETPTFELTPFIGARMGGGFDVENDTTGVTSSADLDSSTSYGIDVGLYKNAVGFYELLYSTQETSLDLDAPGLGDVDVRVDYLQVGGTAFFDQDQRWLPYLSMTVGAAMLKPTQGDYDSETKFAMSLGGGLRFPFNDRVAATLGVRAYLTFLSSDTGLFCVSTGENAGCLVKSSGSTFWQGEGQLGLTVRF